MKPEFPIYYFVNRCLGRCGQFRGILVYCGFETRWYVPGRRD